MLILEEIQIVKVLGNNVIVAEHPEYSEVILVGKGIGFGRTSGSMIDLNTIEKTFVLYDEKEREKYRQLLVHVDEKVIVCMDEVMSFLSLRFGTLPQEFLVNLTDHVSFCISRILSGMVIQNSILKEIKLLYPSDYLISKKVCEIIYQHLQVELPEDEVGFVALYIHAASNNRATGEVRNNAQVIQQVIELIEKEWGKPINRDGLFYNRFLHHLQLAIITSQSANNKSTKNKISKAIQDSYPETFQLARKIGSLLSKRLKVEVAESEIDYLTIHLERIRE